mmetsp:Transcript_34868/g.72650  ORF Transcript_34868/g.72650 Transcript_34868/m.72650 type:complete len:311 (-) Transcript_34868:151-1083(-)
MYASLSAESGCSRTSRISVTVPCPFPGRSTRNLAVTLAYVAASRFPLRMKLRKPRSQRLPRRKRSASRMADLPLELHPTRHRTDSPSRLIFLRLKDLKSCSSRHNNWARFAACHFGPSSESAFWAACGDFATSDSNSFRVALPCTEVPPEVMGAMGACAAAAALASSTRTAGGPSSGKISASPKKRAKLEFRELDAGGSLVGAGTCGAASPSNFTKPAKLERLVSIAGISLGAFLLAVTAAIAACFASASFAGPGGPGGPGLLGSSGSFAGCFGSACSPCGPPGCAGAFFGTACLTACLALGSLIWGSCA